MTTINEQNAKQIRKPMEVYVRMDLSDKSITMTYSGYSSAKIADGKLDQTDWKMRKLTDLQGDGYPLDESCVLYNPNTTSSARNGKIGIRGNIGEPVSVTITGSDVMDSVSISVTGASAVTHDGGTSTISGGTSIISVEATTTTLTFTPKSADRRVEISDILPGVVFNVTNETMISCTLSLRADLSIIDPTLPESEMNLEFYYDEDISETLAAIPEDTPITYRAGYDGDLSPERKFYIADQVAYKDNVVSVHAVDAVHFFDKLPYALATVDRLYDNVGGTNDDNSDLYYFTRLLGALVYMAIPGTYRDYVYAKETTRKTLSRCVFENGSEVRNLLAQAMAYFHIADGQDFCDSGDVLWPVYVDAGRPDYRAAFNSSATKRRVYETDCADIERKIEKKISKVLFSDRQLIQPPIGGSGDYRFSHIEVGSASWYQGEPAYVSLDDYTFFWAFGFFSNEFNTQSGMSEVEYVLPASSNGWYKAYTDGIYPTGIDEQYVSAYGTILMSQGVSQQTVKFYADPSETSGQIGTQYNQVIPANAYYMDTGWFLDNLRSTPAMWNRLKALGVVSDGNNMTVPAYGGKLQSEDNVLTFTSEEPGDTVEIDLDIKGRVFGTRTENGRLETIFPDLCMQSIFDKSPNKGSFTWKGDPRMQPRDVFTFVKLDGTEIDCTIEQIDLEHVGGGTTARITYREGIV